MPIIASIPDDEAYVTRELADLKRDLRELGPSVAESFRPVVANLQQTIETRLATDYLTRAQTEAKVATPGDIAPGNVTASGDITTTGSGSFPGGLTSQNVRSFVVSTNYAGVWVDGATYRLGISPSTRRFKTDIVEWREDADRFLDVAPVKYRLRIPDREVWVVDEAGTPVLDGNGVPVSYIEPGFADAPDTPLRAGFIAEELVEAGFEESVVFDDDGRPVSINYAEVVVPQQMALRALRERITTLEAALAAVERKLASVATMSRSA